MPFGHDALPIETDQAAGMMVDLPGFCSTPGCHRPHDAACNPCGHTVCCWDCLNEIKAKHGRCPVCNVEIQETFLCYEPRGEFEF